MVKRFIIAIILLAIVVGGIVGFNMYRDRAIQQYFANAPVQPTTVSTIKVEPVTWQPTIETIGTISAAEGVDLTVETTGIVKEVKFKANDSVSKGALLVQLDDTVQKADLLAGQTQAKLDLQALDRAIELQRRGVGTDAQLDAARAASETSASQVTKLQAVLDQKLLIAPFKGMLGIPRVEVGQYLTPGNVVATLQDLETMRADFAVPEQELAQLKMGQSVVFGMTSEDMPFKGMVTGIDPKVDPQSRLVSVRAEISNPDGKLSPGQFVQVRVELPKQDNIIAIPQTALVSSLYGDYVYVVKPAQAKPAASAPAPSSDAKPAATGGAAAPAANAASGEAKPALEVSQVFVKVGRRSGAQVEITQNLEAGAEIVIAGQNRLSNGGPVVIDNSASIDPPAKAATK